MLAYRTPGVYFEWLDQRGPAMVPLRTDIAGFVGITLAGPLDIPVKIESFTQFVSIFGGHTPQGFLAYSVEGFFANGGQTCWVVRVADKDRASAASFAIRDDTGAEVIEVKAISRFTSSDGTARKSDNPGRRGEDITLRVSPTAPDRFTLIVSLDNTREIWRDLSLSSRDKRNAITLITDPLSGSRLVKLEVKKSNPTFPLNLFDPAEGGANPPLEGTAAFTKAFEVFKNGPRRELGHLTKGVDGLETLTVSDFNRVGAEINDRRGLATLELIDEVSIVVMPDIMPKPPVTPHKKKPWPPDCSVLHRDEFEQLSAKPLSWVTNECCQPELEFGPPLAADRPLEFPRAFSKLEILALQQTLIAHCEQLKDRVAILDTPLVDPTNQLELTPELATAWRKDYDTKYAALYFPWLRVPDPLRLDGVLRTVPPSGHIAGIYAKGDRFVGVHKPPANEELEGVKDVQITIDDIAHGALNDVGINVIREYRGRGVRVAGARTLSSDAEWLYVNVRRLLIMIEETIDEQTQWTVFEPNNPDTWRAIDRVTRSFLDGLWRRGMLDGATAAEAYSVRCDETTNPPEEVEQGRTICEVGVLPPWPAEFVVVRIGKSQGGTEILERET
jgi:hypothetical protein